MNFVNLSPSPLLDWVDVHMKSSSGALALATGSAAPVDAQLNFRMGLAAGPPGTMHMQMAQADGGKQTAGEMPDEHSGGEEMAGGSMGSGSMAGPGAMPMPMGMADRPPAPLGMSASLSQSVLRETGGSQIFSFALPALSLGGADQSAAAGLLQVKFTYCAAGADCDTEEFTYDLGKLSGAKLQLAQAPTTHEGEEHEAESLTAEQPESLKAGQPQLQPLEQAKPLEHTEPLKLGVPFAKDVALPPAHSEQAESLKLGVPFASDIQLPKHIQQREQFQREQLLQPQLSLGVPFDSDIQLPKRVHVQREIAQQQPQSKLGVPTAAAALQREQIRPDSLILPQQRVALGS